MFYVELSIVLFFIVLTVAVLFKTSNQSFLGANLLLSVNLVISLYFLYYFKLNLKKTNWTRIISDDIIYAINPLFESPSAAAACPANANVPKNRNTEKKLWFNDGNNFWNKLSNTKKNAHEKSGNIKK